MSLTRRAFLFLGSILLFPLHAYAKRYRTKIDPKTGYYVLSPEQIACIQKRIQLELKLNPFYVWGAAGLAPGAPGDCSGKMYAIFFCCGVPVQRVTAAWMGKGLGGWKFPRVEYEKGKRLAIVIMTTQKHRPDGHVGIALEDVYGGSTIIANASSKYGFITMVVERTKANRLKMYMKQTVQ